MIFMRKLPLPKINLKTLRTTLTIFGITAVSFTLGYFIGVKKITFTPTTFPGITISRDLPENREDVDFSLFWRVWDTLETSYFDKTKLDAVDMVYGAVKGMVAAVGDPYTVFLPPEQNKVVQEDLQGTFEGVGIQIGFKGTQLAVIAPLPDTPAEKAGVKAGDLIIGIKDEVKGIDRGTVSITLPEAVQAIRGPRGTIVTLALLRDGEDAPLEIDIVRESIDVPSVILSLVGENEDVAHIRLLKFSGETENGWEETVREVLKNPQIKAIVLDVRNNPGGFLQSAVDVAGEFLQTGEVVVIEEKANGDRFEFRSMNLGRLTNVPLVILVNEGSASASEILAGALRDLKNTKLVGETTFGKGTIQEPRQVVNGAGLHVTTARWLTPEGTWVNEEGIEPDIVVKDDPETSEDEQLQEALNLLGK